VKYYKRRALLEQKKHHLLLTMRKNLENTVLNHIRCSAEARSRLLGAMVSDQEAIKEELLLSSALAVRLFLAVQVVRAN
jgi:hypothetical protein